MRRLHLLLLSLIFAMGFFLGRITQNKLSSKTETLVTESKKQEFSQVQTLATTKKDSTTVKLSSRKEIYYSPKGNIHKVVIVDEKLDEKTLNDSLLTLNSDSLETDEPKTEKKSIGSYKTNWLVGISTDAKNATVQNGTALVGYRLIGDIYLTASTNVEFKTQFGLIYSF